MPWQWNRERWVLSLDGSDRLDARPRITVFRVNGGWGVAVHLDASRVIWPSGMFARDVEAKRAGLNEARRELGPEWHGAIDAALDELA